MRKRNILESFSYAISGILYCIKTQRNYRIHCVAAIGALLLSYIYNFSEIEILILLFTIALVIVTEMINTAIEKSVDIAVDAYHPLAKVAKDIAAGAVFVSSLNAIIVFYFLFIKNDRTSTLLSGIFTKDGINLLSIVFILILIVILIFINIKPKGIKK